MRVIEIIEVSIDRAGRLLIHPAHADPSFQYVYRAVAEVTWDSATACFACPKPTAWSYLQWFEHARTAVRSELGYDLKLSEHTVWTNVPEGLKGDLQSAPSAG